MIVEVFSLLVVILGWCYFGATVREYLRYRILFYKLPSPKSYPFLGHTLDLICDEGEFFRRVRKFSRENGPLYSLSAFSFVTANISGAEEFELVASSMKNIKKGPVYAFLKRWLGDGLLISTGAKWHTRRKILTPAFHFSILQQFIKNFYNETERLVQNLKKDVDKPYIDVVPLVSQSTLYAITETAMGTKLDISNEADKTYVSAIYKMGKIVYHRVMRPWFYVNSIFYNFTPLGYYEKRVVNVLHKFTQSVIKARTANFEVFTEVDNHAQRKKMAMLDLLLNAKINSGLIEDKGIENEVNTFMFEGHDTTSTAICFTLMLLACHQDAQEAIYQEISQVIGDFSKEITIKDLNELKYMERCIKESLRLYPSVPYIGRILEEEVTNDQGYTLPKRAGINIHIFDIHRNPKYWPEPDKFDPDRFLPENCVNRHPFAYVPFSAGPRNCIGQKFAILEIKMFLCGILSNFVLEPVDTPETITLVPDMVLRTANETLRVKFSTRIK